MNIILKELRIKNFKGIIDLVVRFDHESFLYGANGTGKTTIADAWYWLLFGKNSGDEADFNIKNTVDIVRNREEHEVQGVLIVNGEETLLRKVYKEKWVKKRGEVEATYTGNENLFFWNEVPCQLREYQGKIAKLMEESLFKLVTNPAHFNTIKWEDRRAVLIAMAGKVSDADVAANNKDFQELLVKVGGNTLKEHKAMLAARKKKLKDELKDVPARIDELYRSLPEHEPDFTTLQDTIDKRAAELTEVDGLLMNKSAAQRKFQDDQSAIHKKIGELNRQLADLQFARRNGLLNADRDATSEIEQAKGRIKALNNGLAQLNQQKAYAEAEIQKCVDNRTKFLAELEAIKALKFEYKEFEFDENNKVCQHCKQALPEEDINVLRTKLHDNYTAARNKAEYTFNQDILRKRTDNRNAGVNNNTIRENHVANLELITDNLSVKQAELETEKKTLTDLETQFVAPRPIEERLAEVMANNKEAIALKNEIQAQKDLLKEEPADDNADLKARKTELANELTELNKQLGQKESITTTKNRISELKTSEKKMAQDLASAEREEYTLLQFEKARIEVISSRVNHKFKYVTFKMFEYTIEGGESPCCETMLDGVPYSDLNTAGQMKAGIDIINALCEHYGVRAPIFIDNRESVTEIPETDSQVINLVVNPDDKKLRIIAKAAGFSERVLEGTNGGLLFNA